MDKMINIMFIAALAGVTLVMPGGSALAAVSFPPPNAPCCDNFAVLSQIPSADVLCFRNEGRAACIIFIPASDFQKCTPVPAHILCRLLPTGAYEIAGGDAVKRFSFDNTLPSPHTIAALALGGFMTGHRKKRTPFINAPVRI